MNLAFGKILTIFKENHFWISNKYDTTFNRSIDWPFAFFLIIVVVTLYFLSRSLVQLQWHAKRVPIRDLGKETKNPSNQTFCLQFRSQKCWFIYTFYITAESFKFGRQAIESKTSIISWLTTLKNGKPSFLYFCTRYVVVIQVFKFFIINYEVWTDLNRFSCLLYILGSSLIALHMIITHSVNVFANTIFNENTERASINFRHSTSFSWLGYCVEHRPR